MLFRFFSVYLFLALILCLRPLTCVALDDAESQSLNTLNEDADQSKTGAAQSPSWWPSATPDDANSKGIRDKTANELQAKMRELNDLQRREAAQLQEQRLAQLHQMEEAEQRRLAAAAQREREQRDAAERQQSLMAHRQIEEQRAAAARRQAEILAAERRAAQERALAAQRLAASQQEDLARQAEMEAEANRQQEENRQAEDGMMHWRVKYGSGWHRADNPLPQDVNQPSHSDQQTVGMPNYGISDNWAAPQNEGGSVNGKPKWSSPHDIRLSRPVTPATDGNYDVGDSHLPPISRQPARRSSALAASPNPGAEGASLSSQQTSQNGAENVPPNFQSQPNNPAPVGLNNPLGENEGEESLGHCPNKTGCKEKKWHPQYAWRKKGLMRYKVDAPPTPPVAFPAQENLASPAVQSNPQPQSTPSTTQTLGASHPSPSEDISSKSSLIQPEVGEAPIQKHKTKKSHHKKPAPKPVKPEEESSTETSMKEASPKGEVTPPSSNQASSNGGAATSPQPSDFGEVTSVPRTETHEHGSDGMSTQTTPDGVAIAPEQQQVLRDLVRQERALLHEGPREDKHAQEESAKRVLPTPTEVSQPKKTAPVTHRHHPNHVPRVVSPSESSAQTSSAPIQPVRQARPTHHFKHRAGDQIMPKAVRVGAPAAPPQQAAYEPAAPSPPPVATAPPSMVTQHIATRQEAPAVPMEQPVPSSPPAMTQQKVEAPPAATFQEPEQPRTHVVSNAPQPITRQAPVQTVASRHKQVVSQPPPIEPNFTPRPSSNVTSQEEPPPQGYAASQQRAGGTDYATENANRTALTGAYHPSAMNGTGSAATGTGTAGGSRHGIFAAGRVMGARPRTSSVLDLPGHWEGAVAALTGDSWSVIQTHRDPFFYGEPEDRTPAGQPLCHMVKVDGESTLDFSTSPSRELGGHIWDVDLHNAGLTSRPGVSVPITMRASGGHGAPLSLNGVQYSGTLRVADLNNEAAARIAKLFTQSQRVVIGTDQGQFDVDTSGFGKGNARHAFTYCLTQDLSAEAQ